MNDKDFEKLVFGMAHQIRNPAAIIKANAGVILETERLSPAARRSMESILNGVKYLEDRLDEFVEFSKPLTLNLQKTDVAPILSEACSMLKDQCSLKKAVISSKLESVALERADRNQLFLAFMNVLLNAIEAVPERGTVTVETRRQDGAAQVVIRDNGPGIHPRDMPEIFSAFYSTKPNSIGIGLPVAKRILQAHRGDITVQSEQGRGTSVTLTLPNG
ncbi:MAG: hypothetical protein A2901_04275 [Elusimicrobia bacterium RIFCSPLOWO2_01_FULL_54_10]|nr:MAG: hypothetical protein A2901_04275 [Elusimicrobia bacterium RIFCSPLOWO2_01_FULL_54_10]